MTASALQEFLRSLGESLAAVGVPAKSLDDLRAAATALAPFADMDLEQLADFLKRAAEFRRTGAVPAVSVPGLDDLTRSTRDLGDALPAAADGGDVETRIRDLQRALQNAMQTVAGHFGIAAKFTEDKKWLAGLQAKAAVTRAVDAFRKLQQEITSTDAYQSEAVKGGIADLATADAKVLKAAAAELGVAARGKESAFVAAVLVKLTGIDNKPPRAVKKPKPEEPVATVEQVEAMVNSLQAMIERAKDPDAVADAEIDAILNRVKTEFSTEQQKGIAKRVTGKGGRSSQTAIDFLRADLTAVKRALESQKV